MIPLSLAEITAIVAGQPHDIPDPDRSVTGPVVIDSREARPGSLFAALPGTRVDGHDFAHSAVAAGATAVLATRPVGVPAVVVDDVTAALGALARHTVDRLTDTTVVALTGSAGKTSTKDLLAQLLERRGPTVWTPGNFNNEIGLPVAVLRSTPDNKHAVVIAERVEAPEGSPSASSVWARAHARLGNVWPEAPAELADLRLIDLPRHRIVEVLRRLTEDGSTD